MKENEKKKGNEEINFVKLWIVEIHKTEIARTENDIIFDCGSSSSYLVEVKTISTKSKC